MVGVGCSFSHSDREVFGTFLFDCVSLIGIRASRDDVTRRYFPLSIDRKRPDGILGFDQRAEGGQSRQVKKFGAAGGEN